MNADDFRLAIVLALGLGFVFGCLVVSFLQSITACLGLIADEMTGQAAYDRWREEIGDLGGDTQYHLIKDRPHAFGYLDMLERMAFSLRQVAETADETESVCEGRNRWKLKLWP